MSTSRDLQLARSRTASREAFQRYVATEPSRVDAFRRAVARRGGPAEGSLDLSRDSLVSLGAWLLRPFVPGPEDEFDAHWAVVYPEGHAERPEAWLLDGAATYFAAALRQHHPALTWTLDEERRSGNYLRPVLGSFGGATLWPFTPVAGGRNAERQRAQPRDDWLARVFDFWSSAAPAAADGAGTGPAPADALSELVDVDAGAVDGDPRWNAELWITEAAEPILGTHEFERLPQRLAAIPGVEDLAWEDREHVLLRLRRGTDLSAVRSAARAALRAAYDARQGDAD